MMLYIDRLNGVWSYDPDPGCTEDHHWRLVAKTNHFDHRDFVVDALQNTASIRFLAPFKRLVSGGTFEFPPEYKKGDKVWIDSEWLYHIGIDHINDYIGQPGRIGGEVVKQDSVPGGFVEVSVKIQVPISNITKK